MEPGTRGWDPEALGCGPGVLELFGHSDVQTDEHKFSPQFYRTPLRVRCPKGRKMKGKRLRVEKRREKTEEEETEK